MRAKLVSRAGGETREFPIEGAATIGRGKESSIRLPIKAISSQHAKVEFDAAAGRYMLEDLGSTNGTELDGTKIEGREPLGHLNVITLAGKVDLVFADLDLIPPPPGAAPACPPAAPAPAPPSRPQPKTAAPAPEPPAKPAAPAEAEQTAADAGGIALPPGLEQPGAPADASPQVPGEATQADGGGFVLPSNLGEQEQKPAKDVPDGERTQADQDVFVAPPALPGDEPPEQQGSAPERTQADAVSVGLPPGLPDPQAVDNVGSAFSGPLQLEFSEWSGPPLRVPLSEGENLVGRTPEAHVKIDSFDVSRRHAMLTLTGNRLTVRDLDSSTGTFVDDKKIDREVEVSPGAQLRFGNVRARIIAGSG